MIVFSPETPDHSNRMFDIFRYSEWWLGQMQMRRVGGGIMLIQLSPLRRAICPRYGWILEATNQKTTYNNSKKKDATNRLQHQEYQAAVAKAAATVVATTSNAS